MKDTRLNNFIGWSSIVSGSKKIMKDDVVPKQLSKHVVAQQITHDYILELYEKSKKLRGKNKQAMIDLAEKLSKHVGQWLVEK